MFKGASGLDLKYRRDSFYMRVYLKKLGRPYSGKPEDLFMVRVRCHVARKCFVFAASK